MFDNELRVLLEAQTLVELGVAEWVEDAWTRYLSATSAPVAVTTVTTAWLSGKQAAFETSQGGL